MKPAGEEIAKEMAGVPDKRRHAREELEREVEEIKREAAAFGRSDTSVEGDRIMNRAMALLEGSGDLTHRLPLLPSSPEISFLRIRKPASAPLRHFNISSF